MNSDLNHTAAREFIAVLQDMLGSPRVGGDTPAERERALSAKYRGMIEKLDRFSPSVLKRAADMIIENRKSFPALADCIQVCSQIEARDKEAISPSRTKTLKKRDWSDPAIAREADGLLLCDVHLARLAEREGWLRELWHFCAAQGRLPAGCNPDGDDERFALHQQAMDTKAGMAEIKRHPDGSICEKCARQRGARPIRPINETWIARCMHCGFERTCSSPVEWSWTGIGVLVSSARQRLRFQSAIESKSAQLEQRLIDLIEGKRAA